MTTKGRREDLMIYLADATDKKVNALYTLLEEEIKEHSFTLSQEQINILDERRADYMAGKAKPRPWEEVHARVKCIKK